MMGPSRISMLRKKNSRDYVGSEKTMRASITYCQKDDFVSYCGSIGRGKSAGPRCGTESVSRLGLEKNNEWRRTTKVLKVFPLNRVKAFSFFPGNECLPWGWVWSQIPLFCVGVHARWGTDNKPG